MNNPSKLKSTRILIAIFMVSLLVSGLTAIPLHAELSFLEDVFARTAWIGFWITKVHAAYNEVSQQHPFLFYGYDWLAFAHFVLAILFIGPYRDPIRNIWVIQFGLIACILVIPFAFVAGYFRGIPVGWRIVDCSFGVVGYFLLSAVYSKTNSIEPSITKTTIA